MRKKLTLAELETAADRFWSNVDIGNNDDCWVYQGTVAASGYGLIGVARRQPAAHRVAWMLQNKKLIPDTMFVLHSCDNKACCNPNHLRLGTHRDNMNDAVMRNRILDTRARGTGHYNSNLTEGDILAIRGRFAKGEMSVVLAEEFNLSTSNIHNIVYGKSYSKIGGPLAGRDYLVKRRQRIWLDQNSNFKNSYFNRLKT